MDTPTRLNVVLKLGRNASRRIESFVLVSGRERERETEEESKRESQREREREGPGGVGNQTCTLEI